MTKRTKSIIAVISVCVVALAVVLGAYAASEGWIFQERLTEDEVQTLVVADLVEMGVMQYPLVVDFTCTYVGDWIWYGSCVEQWGTDQPTHGWVFYERIRATQLIGSTKFDY